MDRCKQIRPGVSFQNELPYDLYNQPHKLTCRLPGNRKIDFGGYEWVVKQSDAQIGPDSNYWTDDPDHVYVDEEGVLHLKIVNSNDLWSCTEIISDKVFGYGSYSFTVKLATGVTPFTVLGFFTWDEYANNEYYREVDIEIGSWGDQSNDNFQYVIQPWNNPQNIHRFNVPDYDKTTHRFTWKTDTIEFLSLTEDSSVVNSWIYIGNDFYEPSLTTHSRINLWLFQHHLPQQEVEYIISDFNFEYLLIPPTGVDASDGIDSTKVIVRWDDMGEGLFYGVYRINETNPLDKELLTAKWLNINLFYDTTANSDTYYNYYIRCSDNPAGSNVSGYTSGFSEMDKGWTFFHNTKKDSTNIFIYPNPFSNITTIEFTNPNLSNYKLLVYNICGSKVFELDNIKTDIIQFERENLVVGVYILELRGEKVFRGKIIVK